LFKKVVRKRPFFHRIDLMMIDDAHPIIGAGNVRINAAIKFAFSDGSFSFDQIRRLSSCEVLFATFVDEPNPASRSRKRMIFDQSVR